MRRRNILKERRERREEREHEEISSGKRQREEKITGGGLKEEIVMMNRSKRSKSWSKLHSISAVSQPREQGKNQCDASIQLSRYGKDHALETTTSSY